jgi:flagellar basal-body rod protein FlgB
MTTSAFGIDVLARVLDNTSLRHRVIAQNVANVNTPGYRRLEIAFEDLLSAASDASPSKPQVVEVPGTERVDGNTVDIDREMGDLTKNALLFQAATQILASRMAAMRSAITGR